MLGEDFYGEEQMILAGNCPDSLQQAYVAVICTVMELMVSVLVLCGEGKVIFAYISTIWIRPSYLVNPIFIYFWF